MGMRLVWATLAGAVVGTLAMAFIFYPPTPGWAAHTVWGDKGNVISAIATSIAAVVALWLGVRDGFRHRDGLRARGRIALALSLPELVRIRVLLSEIQKSIDELIQLHGTNVGIIDDHPLDRCKRLAPSLKSSLESAPVDHFIGMPEFLQFNLPTVIHGVAQMTDLGPRIRGAYHMPTNEDLLFYRQYVFDHWVDFEAAVQYVEKHIVPDQVANMRGIARATASRLNS